MTDRQILDLYLQRDESAIDRTREKFGAYLRSIAWNILHSREDTEECENDTYMSAWQHIPPAEPDPMRPYLGKTARNFALTRCEYYAADKRSRDMTVAMEELSTLSLPDDAYEQLALQELGGAIDRFLRTISQSARVIFLRRYWYLESVEEVSKRLGFSQARVKSSLFRTRSALREFLRKEGYAV